jgi:hypothetical protein
MATPVSLTPRPVAASVDELFEGASARRPFRTDDARATVAFEQVEVDGQRCVVKYVHPDDDFTLRVTGDIGCRPLRVWASGLMDLAPDVIDHATLGVAPWGRNGWGAAVLMRDVGDALVPPGDEPVDEARHLAYLDHLAAFAACSWGWVDDLDLLPHRLRWGLFGIDQLAGEADLGYPEAVPRIAAHGWSRFRDLAPRDIAAVVDQLRRDPLPLSRALKATPSCFLHGDWKFGNLGTGADGRTILIDWALSGEGPVGHELAWYLALNRARLPVGHTKESSIDAFRGALEGHGVTTDGWWDAQLELCLLGALVEFGWEKALGDDEDARAELGWWVEAARPGGRRL